MSRMKTLAKLEKKAGIWVSEAEKPTPGALDVLIKIKQTAICGTDVHIYKWDAWAESTIPVPMHVGHEFVGHVVAVGDDVKGFSVGDRVSGEGHITCGYCRNCRAGRRHLCRHTEGVGVNRPGAFAEYLCLPACNAVLIPDDIPDEIAAVMDPLGNAVHTALAFDVIGEDVLITGAGPVGLFAAAICQHVGARHVVITDVNDARLAIAEKLGVSRAVNVKHTELSDVVRDLGMTEGFDVCLEMSGNAQAVADMLTVMNNGGRIAMLGIPPKPYEIDWNTVVFKALTIRGIYGREMFETWYKMISLLQSGLDVSPVITHHFPVDDFQEGFDVLLSGDTGKVILDWE